ncbi:MAG: twin-arginine translocase subunit TatC [Pseudomonadota bacterium]
MSDPADQQAENTFIGHLLELRSRLVKSVLALLAGFAVAYPFSRQIYAFLAAPLTAVLPPDSKLIFTSLPEVFLTYVKLSMLAGFFFALPVILYQFWAFVAPGLYQHERRLFFPMLFASVALFFGGAAFAYYLVFPAAFHFFISFAGGDITAMPAVRDYLSLAITFMLAFGAAFQIPVLTVVLAKIGVVSVATLKRSRRYVLLGCFIVAAVVTPPDVLSQFMLAVPMYLLFELGLVFVGMTNRSAETAAGAAAPEAEGEASASGPVDMDQALDDAERELSALNEQEPPSSTSKGER